MDALIREILVEHGNVSKEFDVDTDLYRVGLTSHATINVMLALEDHFDVDFEPNMLRKSTFESVAAIRAALVDLGATVPA